MMQSRTVTVSVAASPAAICSFVSDPLNLPRWLGFCRSVAHEAGEWRLQTDIGEIALRFVEPNPFGVLDHVVRLPDGAEVRNPMRVVPNGDGSEVMFTLFRAAGIAEAQFLDDAREVERDLAALKRLMETGTGKPGAA